MISKVHSFRVRRLLYNVVAHEKIIGKFEAEKFLGNFPRFTFCKDFRFSSSEKLSVSRSWEKPELLAEKPGVSLTHFQAFLSHFPSSETRTSSEIIKHNLNTKKTSRLIVPKNFKSSQNN
jgi:hypothetical protein